MENKKWWLNAVLYEMYVDKFAGDFRGLTAKLDYLEKLGITCIHLLPHYPSPMIDDGYDISDYRNVRPELGTLGDFAICIKEARAKGIRVIIDFVLNHISSEHPWFVDARASKESPYRNYFLWSETGNELKDSQNLFPHLKPSNWIENEQTNDYYFATFYPEQPDLNWNEPKVMEEMLAIIDFWTDIGVSGFRLDAAAHLIKKEGTTSENLPETHAVLKKIRAHIDQTSPDSILLAEVCDKTDITMEYFGSGDECHLIYDFPLAAQMLVATKRNDTESMQFSETELTLPKGCQWAVFLRHHDECILSMITKEDRDELLGNGHLKKYYFRDEKGLSARLATIFEEEDPQKIRTAFKTLLSVHGTPIIYYGEEIGMKNDTTIGEQKDTRRYVRGVFDWESANEQITDPDSLFSFVANEIRTKK